ncbi:MAG: hypothetical protein ACPGU1_13295 [Myxococcota bacterium]
MLFVHQGTADQAEAFFAEMEVPDARHVSDPKRRLYKALEIGKGGLMSLMNPAMIKAGKAAWEEGFRQGRTVGSAAQLHGLALVEDGVVIDVQRPEHAGVEVDHERVASCSSGACQVF